MSNRRTLKRTVNTHIADVIDHCYDIAAVSPDKEVNGVIDAAVTLYNDLLVKINVYKTQKNKSAYFSEIKLKMEKEIEVLNEKIKTL